MKKSILMTITFVSMFVCMSVTQAQTKLDTLKQYVSDLQRNAHDQDISDFVRMINDNALREKIIKLVQMMKQSPAIPEEARKHFIKGGTLFKDAKTPDDYVQVGAEFTQALLIAPWWQDAYYNLASTYEVASEYADAITMFRYYQLFKLSTDEERLIKDKIYALEAKWEKQQKDRKLAAKKEKELAAEKTARVEEDPFEALLRKIDGRRYTLPGRGGTLTLDVRSKVLVGGAIDDDIGYREEDRWEIKAREFTYPVTRYDPRSIKAVECTFTISEDGDRITERVLFSDGTVYEHIFLWQK